MLRFHLNSNSSALTRIRELWFAILTLVLCGHAQANCDGFIRWSAETLDSYQSKHRIYPVPTDLQQLARQHLPNLWVHPSSYQPINFDHYLTQATLYDNGGKTVLAKGESIRISLANLSREDQCATFISSPEQQPAEQAPVYVQVYRDHGPTDGSVGKDKDKDKGGADWLYLKYTWVFDWSGLAKQRGWISRVGTALSGGRPHKWHRLDVHTSAVLGLDANRTLRTLSLQQHNNKRTHVAGLDFPLGEPLHLVAAATTNELYLDTGSAQPEERRAVATFLQWPHLIDEQHKTMMWQRDELFGRNAGGVRVTQYATFIDPDHPLAAYAGLLAPKRRILGIYVGRDGPPGYDFDGVSDLPETTVIGFWREGDTDFLPVLEEHLNGFSDTNWTAIADYLRPKLKQALFDTSSEDEGQNSL